MLTKPSFRTRPVGARTWIPKVQTLAIISSAGLDVLGSPFAEGSRNRGAFVAVDFDRERLAATCERRGWSSLVGDAMKDDVLLQAGVRQTATLTCLLPTDVGNAFVALSARMLAPDLRIIACARRPGARKQLTSAGADHVISPHKSEIKKIARSLVHQRKQNLLN